MRFLLLICLCLTLCNCQDEQSKKKNNTSVVDSVKTVKKPIKEKDTIVIPERKFPLLNDANAMDFFLEYEKENKEDKVRITTDYGTIDILLFDKTKFHRANFIFLTKQNYFDNTQFYRIVNNFIIQGGSSDDREITNKRTEIGRYLLPRDTKRGYKHNRGVLSMPSSDIENPHKLASPYQFFIVQSRNGAYHLDGNYTAFGKVTKGMDVVDEIAALETDGSEWPLHNVFIRSIEIIE
ncbi:peptidylprolyl isomerase [Lacinutrix undariae]